MNHPTDKILSGLICKAFKQSKLFERQSHCITDIQMAAYLDNCMSDEERKSIEEHLSTCDYCFRILVETKKFTKMDIKEDMPRQSYRKIISEIKKVLRRKRLEALTIKFKELIEKSPNHIRKSLERIREGIETIFMDTFTYPSPRFAPVFGETRVSISSPFGKIRYPILFEWQEYERADSYEISIESADWLLRTNKTKFGVTPVQLKLTNGEEYMWNLRVLNKDKEVIEEENGFFSLLGIEELKEIKQIENQITMIEPEEDRLLLWGGCLEEKELYIDAIQKYKQAYASQPSPGVAYRIAYCYHKLELEGLCHEWNKKIPKKEGRCILKNYVYL